MFFRQQRFWQVHCLAFYQNFCLEIDSHLSFLLPAQNMTNTIYNQQCGLCAGPRVERNSSPPPPVSFHLIPAPAKKYHKKQAARSSISPPPSLPWGREKRYLEAFFLPFSPKDDAEEACVRLRHDYRRTPAVVQRVREIIQSKRR